MTHTFSLQNGVTGVVDTRPGTKKLSINIQFKHGAMHESAAQKGLHNLMSQGMILGTATRSRDDISQQIEGRGAQFAVQNTLSKTSVKSEMLARDVDHVFDVLADFVRNPTFDAANIGTLRDKIKSQLLAQDQNASAKSSSKFVEAVLGPDAGGSIYGEPDLLDSYTPAQIKAAHEDLLAHPDDIVISFSGDISAQQAQQLVTDYFSDLQAAANPRPSSSVSFAGDDIREQRDTEQLNLNIGFGTPGFNDENMYVFKMFSELLSGGMSSPLKEEIREKRGLVYSVHASHSAFEDLGIFSIAAGTGKGQAGELIQATIDLLGTIAQKGFSKTDLKQARERILRRLEAQIESTGATAASNASNILDHGFIKGLDVIKDQLSQITNDDIKWAAAQLLKDGEFGFSGVGPLDTLPSHDDIATMMRDKISGISVAKPSKKTKSAKHLFTQANDRPDLQHDNIQMTTLPNGMRVVTIERPGTISIGAWVGVGADNEAAHLNGATHMNEHMMFRGTPSYPPGVISQLVERDFNGGLNAYTSRDQTAYYFYNLKPEHMDKALHVFGEMVFEALIDEGEFGGKTVTADDGTQQWQKGERDVVVEEIKMYLDKSATRGHYLLEELAYPDQPHGRTIIGTESVLKAMSADQLRGYRDEYYVPNNTVFLAAGPVKHDDFVDLVDLHHGDRDWQDIPDTPPPTYFGGTQHAEFQDAQLVNLTIGAQGVSITDADYQAYQALGRLLGAGKSSRLNRSVVLNQKLAPSVAAGMAAYRDHGLFQVITQLAPENIKPFIEASYQEIAELVNNLSDLEVAKVKKQMEMSILNAVETNQSAAMAHGRSVLAKGEIQEVDEAIQEIQALTRDDICIAAERVLNSNPTVSMIVRPGTDPSLIPDHDEVVKLKDKAVAAAAALGKTPSSGSQSQGAKHVTHTP